VIRIKFYALIPILELTKGCKILSGWNLEVVMNAYIMLCELVQFLSELTWNLLLNRRSILNLRKIDELNILEN